MKRGYLIFIILLFLVSCTQAEIQENITIENNTEQNIPTENETIPETINEPNLIAYWNFDEIEQNTLKDLANNNNGIIYGNPELRTGKINKAIYFDGVDDYVKFSQETLNTIGNLNQGTIAFWFNFNSLLDTQTVMPLLFIGMDNEQDTDNLYVIELGHSSFEGLGTRPDPNNKKLYSTWIRDNREPFLCFDSNRDLEENKWHHFALVVGSDGNTGYLDGVEITNRRYNFGNENMQAFLNIPQKEMFSLAYGRNSHMISPNFVYYKGYLDEMKIYDRALTSEEIEELFS